MVVFNDAFAGKSVLVTGHTGFKGSWLTAWLIRLGAKVRGYALAPPTKPNLFEACDLRQSMDHREADVRDRAALRATVAECRPDFIFHLAAQPLVRDSYERPVETYEVNAMGTINVLEAVRNELHRCSIVVVSTDKCYENREWEYGYREIDPLGGHDPYSSSKAAMEIAVASYRSSFFTPGSGIRLASARAGNVIGGGDWSTHRIVPDTIRALQTGETVVVRHPDSVRPWQHVLEPLGGYLWLAARLTQVDGQRLSGAWNFGPTENEARSVADLVDAMIAAWGSGRWTVSQQEDNLHEAGVLKLCIDKADAWLNWRPVWNFDIAVSRTTGWYKSLSSDKSGIRSANAACLDDIRAYEAAAQEKGLAWTR